MDWISYTLDYLKTLWEWIALKLSKFWIFRNPVAFFLWDYITTEVKTCFILHWKELFLFCLNTINNGNWKGLGGSVIGLQAGWSSVWITAGAWDFIFSKTSRLAQRPTQPPVQLVEGLFPWGWSGQGVNLTTHLHPVLRLRMCGDASTPLLCLYCMCRDNLTFITNIIPHTATEIEDKKCCMSKMLDKILC